MNNVYARKSYIKLLTIYNLMVFIPNLLSQNLIEGSLLYQQSLILLNTLLAIQQLNQTLAIYWNKTED